MDSTREHFEQRQVRNSGVASDVRRLREEGSASTAELQKFLGQLKGRSPQEVMGVVAQSNLLRSILTATAGCAVLLVVFTVGPYLLKGASPSVSDKSAAATPGAQATSDTEATSATNDTAVSGAAGDPSTEPNLERAAEAMGIGGTAEADPKTNPLDSKLDKLLDGIE